MKQQFNLGIKKANLAMFGLVIVIGMTIGGFIVSYIFFGMITLVGFIALVEGIKPLKWFVERASSLIDIIIFIATLMATFQLGVTITASLTIAGLGFTLLYAPYLRARHRARKLKKQNNKYYGKDKETKNNKRIWYPYKNS